MIRLVVDDAREGSLNMAIDLAVAELSNVKKVPTLRIYEWSKPTLSLGRNQKTKNLNWSFIEKKGIDVVRRPSGGRGVLHNKEITYSFSISKSSNLLPNTLMDSYMKISRALIESFLQLGIESHMEPSKSNGLTKDFCYDASSFYEVKVDGKKLIGSAQYRKPYFILQHGSIPIKFDYESYINSFNYANSEKIKSHLLNSTIDIENILKRPLSKKELADAFKIGFEKVFSDQVFTDYLDSFELEYAQKIKDRFIVVEGNY